jgi:hypothetical protein
MKLSALPTQPFSTSNGVDLESVIPVERPEDSEPTHLDFLPCFLDRIAILSHN